MRLSAGRARLLKGLGMVLAVSLASPLTGGGFRPENEAHAIIGRPLTPLSYAGVARRTVRRSAYVGAATVGAAATVGVAAAAATVATLPSGCMAVGGTYSCGGTYYRPYYDGPNVVYQTVPPP